jgi:predicted secreted protein
MRRSAALAAFLIVACPATAGVVSPTLSLSGPDTQTGSTTLGVGEPLLVVLPAQAGAGYTWEARQADPSVLEPQTAQCAGARGDTPVSATLPACFAWAGRAPGTAVLTFVYRRHWETRPDGVLRYDLTVTVTR